MRYASLHSDGNILLFRDKDMKDLAVGPFPLTRSSQINKIQIYKALYCLSIYVELNNSGLFNVKLGWKSSAEAVSWQEALTKAKEQVMQAAPAPALDEIAQIRSAKTQRPPETSPESFEGSPVD